MATKRMFSLKVVDSDAFMDMPQSVQLLYFHLAMRADDDGFVGNPKSIMKTVGSGDDDIKILLAKNFVIGFQSGVIVIKHHRINNNWDKYNCKRTQYIEELSQLNIKENGSYTTDKTQGLPVQTGFSLKSDFRIEENRIDKNRIEREEKAPVKKENSINFLKELSETDANDLAKEVGCTPNFVREKAKDLLDYCLSKGKIYKNYKAFLRNACRKDYRQGTTKSGSTLSNKLVAEAGKYDKYGDTK